MMEYGLIGRSLKHSFSKNYFENKFASLGLKDNHYELFELNTIEEFPELLNKHANLQGLNVTVPYKEKIVPYLTELSEEVKTIGAVNCIHIKDKKIIGHNTDAYGFAQSIKPFLDTNHQRAMILGSGGAAKAVEYALKKVGVEVYFVSTSQIKKANTFFYSEVNDLVMNAFKLIVNCTPLGMFPKVNEWPLLPYHFFTEQHLAVDLIYNPEETLFLKLAKEHGAITMNGLSMLKLQAEKSWEIWNN